MAPATSAESGDVPPEASVLPPTTHSGSRSHPPTRPDQPAVHRPPVWPTVLGTVLVVMAGCGMLASVWGITSALFVDFNGAFVQGPAAVDMKAMFAAMRPWQVRMGIVSGFGIPIAGVLLASGIGLLLRRAWCAPTAAVWAVLKIAFSVALGVVVYFMQRAQFDSITSTTSSARLPASFGQTIAMVTLGITLVWGSALPVFTLLWFSRPSIRRQLASWRPPSRPAPDTPPPPL